MRRSKSRSRIEMSGHLVGRLGSRSLRMDMSRGDEARVDGVDDMDVVVDVDVDVDTAIDVSVSNSVSVSASASVDREKEETSLSPKEVVRPPAFSRFCAQS